MEATDVATVPSTYSRHVSLRGYAKGSERELMLEATRLSVVRRELDLGAGLRATRDDCDALRAAKLCERDCLRIRLLRATRSTPPTQLRSPLSFEPRLSLLPFRGRASAVQTCRLCSHETPNPLPAALAAPQAGHQLPPRRSRSLGCLRVFCAEGMPANAYTHTKSN